MKTYDFQLWFKTIYHIQRLFGRKLAAVRITFLTRYADFSGIFWAAKGEETRRFDGGVNGSGVGGSEVIWRKSEMLDFRNKLGDEIVEIIDEIDVDATGGW